MPILEKSGHEGGVRGIGVYRGRFQYRRMLQSYADEMAACKTPGKFDPDCRNTGTALCLHPSCEGNRLSAEAFVPFLNRAIRRFGLVSSSQ